MRWRPHIWAGAERGWHTLRSPVFLHPRAAIKMQHAVPAVPAVPAGLGGDGQDAGEAGGPEGAAGPGPLAGPVRGSSFVPQRTGSACRSPAAGPQLGMGGLLWLAVPRHAVHAPTCGLVPSHSLPPGQPLDSSTGLPRHIPPPPPPPFPIAAAAAAGARCAVRRCSTWTCAAAPACCAPRSRRRRRGG